MKLAVARSHAEHNALLRRQQIATSATPGASGSGLRAAPKRRSNAAGASNVASASTTTRPPEDAPRPANDADHDPPDDASESPPLIGVGAPRWIPLPENATDQTVARIKNGLGAGKDRQLWLDMQVRVPACTVCLANVRASFRTRRARS